MRIRLFALVIAASLATSANAIAQCASGSVEIVTAAEAFRPVCGRPVVGLNAAERAQAPSCAGGQTLVRTDDNGFLLCVPSERVTADARPVCFDGANPLRLNGENRCRRAVAERRPGVDLALTGELKAFDNRRGFLEAILFVPDFGIPELGASMVVTATNRGSNPSLPSRISMHFAAGFRDATRHQFTQPCPFGTRPDDAACILVTTETPGRIGNLGRSATCDVPSLGPGASFTCSAGVGPVGKPSGAYRPLKVVATINQDRSQREDRLTNNELALEDRFE